MDKPIRRRPTPGPYPEWVPFSWSPKGYWENWQKMIEDMKSRLQKMHASTFGFNPVH